MRPTLSADELHWDEFLGQSMAELLDHPGGGGSGIVDEEMWQEFIQQSLVAVTQEQGAQTRTVRRRHPIEDELDSILAVARGRALSLGANSHEADEVAQLTVYKVWRKWMTRRSHLFVLQAGPDGRVTSG